MLMDDVVVAAFQAASLGLILSQAVGLGIRRTNKFLPGKGQHAPGFCTFSAVDGVGGRVTRALPLADGSLRLWRAARTMLNEFAA